MNQVKEKMLEICEDFIEFAEKLYKNGEINHKEYVEMTKLKFEYINKNSNKAY